jgi:8-amino-7-oxononanoate synthase
LIRFVGMDSLQLTELTVALEERLGPLGEGIFGDAQMTFSDLVRVLGERAKPLPSVSAPAEPAHAAHPPATRRREERIEEFAEVGEIRTMLLLLRALGVENPYWNSLGGPAQDTAVVSGASMLNFATYNYLGLCGDQRVSAKATQAIADYGTSASASRVASGDRPVHRALEAAIASFLGCEAALVFASGHATNVAALAALVQRGDLLLHDSLAHDSILAGARLSGARVVAFPHGDLDALDRILGELRGTARRALIAVEGAYSMDGDLAPIRDLVALKRRHDAMLYVDEAHSLGCVGATGRGVAEHAGVAPGDVDVWMGTLSKALASCGGYVAGSAALVDLLKYRAGGFVYAAAISPANAAAALEALRILAAEPERVGTLQRRAAQFRELCRARGVDTGTSAGTAIVPAIVGGSVRCIQVAEALRRRGVHAPPIFYPAVEEGRARLRFFVSALHSEAQLEAAADALAAALREHPAAAPVTVARSTPSTPAPPRRATASSPPTDPRRVFVTGGTGFIGSRVVRELAARGAEVRCLVRPTSKTHRLDGVRHEAVRGDLADVAALERAAAGCDAVIHLACASSWSELRALGERVHEVAVGGTRNVLEAAGRAGVRRFVHVSSVAAVNASEAPVLFDETAPYELEGRGLAYSLAKRRAEELVLCHASSDMTVVVASPAEVYGPDDDGMVTAGNLLDILHAATPVACEGGTSIAHVDDVARGVVASLFRGRPRERYILGGDNLTVRELTRLVLRLGGRRDAVIDVPNAALLRLVRLMREAGMTPPVSEDTLDYATLYWFVDSGKARRELGYEARGAEATLAPTVAWLRRSGRWS